ncbi:type II toxin-antitoxin system RelE/ParE family toxin [Kribbella sp. NPDC026596]|uniref:type II toxin-antitoxin system RelE/ParE family toxin n=1 Tax=Kribbella sp. NPDC026596 TaxID=3155122 RepID=UPI0033F713D3
MTWGTVELEAEVRTWLEDLPTDLFARVAFYIDLLAEYVALLGEPYSKQIDGKLRELRFWLDRDAMRISHWIASDRRIILLTVFRKSRMRETREIDRAVKAYRKCVEEAYTVSLREEG